MDHSIVKLPEEDKDITLHSGADAVAFNAAVNRDIESDASASEISDDTSNDENEYANSRIRQQGPMAVTHYEAQSGEMDSKQYGSVDSFTSQADQNVVNVFQAMTLHDSKNVLVDNQGPIKMQSHDHNHELPELKYIINQQPSGTGHQSQLAVAPGESNLQASKLIRLKTVSFGSLLPDIKAHLDEDKAMQLDTLYGRLRENEISKEDFWPQMRSIVEDRVVKMAVYRMSQAANKSSQNVPNQLALQSQAPSQQQ